MHDEILIYPTLFAEHHDEDGHYFVVTSPNIPGMVTEGTTRQQAVTEAIDAIATMLSKRSRSRAMDIEEERNHRLRTSQHDAMVP
jgi:predicted RNase H-like HicB family nuclease